MTADCLKRISPDALTGMIFALEGMRNTVVLLNGPMGCRFYHSTTSQFITVRPLLYLPAEGSGERVPVDYNYLNDWFFRQERVPCTYLDGYDYVYGTREKVAAAMTYIRENVDFDLFAIINSPGAALIGDDLTELTRSLLPEGHAVMLESPGFSEPFEEGYAEALLALLEQTGPALWRDRPAPEKQKKRVNLLGISIWHRYFEGDLKELKRLFALCGIVVTACPCAGSSLADLALLGDADLNVVVYPETGTAAARFLEEHLGTPCYLCSGPPVGFDATERMFSEICAILGLSDAALKTESERARALAWYKIHQVYTMSGKPKGLSFYVGGSPSQKAAYTTFLSDYLAMNAAEADGAELVFADANLISELMLRNRTFCGIEINQPGMGYIDLIPKTHLGIEGALFLTEQVLNGMMSRLS